MPALPGRDRAFRRLAPMKALVEHIAGLRRYARYLTRDSESAEDLVQDCLVAAIAGAHTLRPGAPLRPWLFRIMYANHVAGWRRRARSPIDEGHDEPVDAAVAADQESRVELNDVMRAIDTLPQPQRDAIVLVALEEMTYEQAASVLGVPIGTLMSRLSRGRAGLRRALEHPGQPSLRVVTRGSP